MMANGGSRLVGVLDCRHDLGDILTAQVTLACLAAARGDDGFDVCLLATGEGSDAEDVVPALLTAPMVRSIRLLKTPEVARAALLGVVVNGIPTWPSPTWRGEFHLATPVDHGIINRFFERHGYVPALGAPRGYRDWARAFARAHAGSGPGVAIAASPHGPAWAEFLATAATRQPAAHFWLLGAGGPESAIVDARATSLRASGLGLAHELALLSVSDLFLGGPGVYAAMATFAHVPCAMIGLEEHFARRAGVPHGTAHLPFGTDDQMLVWGAVDTAVLLEHVSRAATLAAASGRWEGGDR